MAQSGGAQAKLGRVQYVFFLADWFFGKRPLSKNYGLKTNEVDYEVNMACNHFGFDRRQLACRMRREGKKIVKPKESDTRCSQCRHLAQQCHNCYCIDLNVEPMHDGQKDFKMQQWSM